jgi:hypothetical protein
MLGLPWKPGVLEKLLRVSLYGSFLVGGLCRPGQNVHWITDDDAIVADELHQKDAGRVMDAMLSRYCPENMGEIRYGIAGKFDDERRAEDLISVVDLAGGALAESLALLGADSQPKSSDLFVPILRHMRTKTELIHNWLCESNVPLKKLLCLVRGSEPGRFLTSVGRPMRPALPAGCKPLWVPPDKGWGNSSRSW